MKLTQSVLTMKDPDYIKYVIKDVFEKANLEVTGMTVAMSGYEDDNGSAIQINTYRVDVFLSEESSVMATLILDSVNEMFASALAEHIAICRTYTSRMDGSLLQQVSDMEIQKHLRTFYNANTTKKIQS